MLETNQDAQFNLYFSNTNLQHQKLDLNFFSNIAEEEKQEIQKINFNQKPDFESEKFTYKLYLGKKKITNRNQNIKKSSQLIQIFPFLLIISQKINDDSNQTFVPIIAIDLSFNPYLHQKYHNKKLSEIILERHQQFTIKLKSNFQSEIKQLAKQLSFYSIQLNFFQQYTLQNLIGKGSIGKVYRADKNSNNKSFAVKKFSKNLIEKQSIKQCMEQELKSLRTLKNHANIIRLFEVFEDDQYIYIITELAKGGNLLDYIKKNGMIQENTCFEIFIQILLAFKFIHSKNIIHRDLKLQNILLTQSKQIQHNFFTIGLIKISDFGLSIQYKESEILLEKCGTPGYIAPEIFSRKYQNGDEGYTKKVDVFSAGVILYTMICGCPPFVGINARDILLKTLNIEPYFSITLQNNISLSLIQLIKLMLIKMPLLRISFEEVLQDNWIVEKLIEYKLQKNNLQKFPISISNKKNQITQSQKKKNKISLNIPQEQMELQNLEAKLKKVSKQILPKKSLTFSSSTKHSRKKLNQLNAQYSQSMEMDFDQKILHSINSFFVRNSSLEQSNMSNSSFFKQNSNYSQQNNNPSQSINNSRSRSLNLVNTKSSQNSKQSKTLYQQLINQNSEILVDDFIDISNISSCIQNDSHQIINLMPNSKYCKFLNKN